MCTIGGVLIFGELNEERTRSIERKLKEIIIRGEERGRDSFGLVTLTRNNEFRIYKYRESPSEAVTKINNVITIDTVAAIFNNRAEPTTEYVMKKTPDDIQPMVGDYIAVVHNGTIANDKDLELKYELKRKSKIDTSIIPPLLEKLWDGSLENLKDIITSTIVGSYALAIIDRRKPGKIWLVTNFKPLYIQWDNKLNAVFFASLDDYIPDSNGPIWNTMPTRRVEPYTAIEIGVDGTWKYVELKSSERPKNKGKVLVVASGGLDSTTTATYLLKEGYEVTLLHFNYGHKAETQEDKAIKSIAEFLGVPLLEVNMDFFRIVRHSPLLGEGEINRVDEGREGAEFAHEWVPARNFVFIALATALAEAYGYDYIATGINLEEAGAYPDNEMEFIRLLNQVMPYAVGPNKHVKLLMPVGHLVKHEIVKLGLEVGAPLHLTWSCYDNGAKHCGRCGPCYMRRWAFKINGIKDPVEYDLPPEVEDEFWKGTKPFIIPKRPTSLNTDTHT